MAGLAETVVLGGVSLVVLYVTLFMVVEVAELHPEDTLYDYSYATTTNSTELDINSSFNASYSFSISEISSIDGKTPIKTISIITNNSDATNYTVTVWLNGVSLTDFVSVKNTATTNSISSVSFVADSDNNISLSSSAGAGTNLSSLSITIKYPDATTNTDIGDTFASLNITVDTVFSVQSLVIIIALLAVAIGAIMIVVNSASVGGRGASL